MIAGGPTGGTERLSKNKKGDESIVPSRSRKTKPGYFFFFAGFFFAAAFFVAIV